MGEEREGAYIHLVHGLSIFLDHSRSRLNLIKVENTVEFQLSAY